MLKNPHVLEDSENEAAYYVSETLMKVPFSSSEAVHDATVRVLENAGKNVDGDVVRQGISAVTPHIAPIAHHIPDLFSRIAALMTAVAIMVGVYSSVDDAFRHELRSTTVSIVDAVMNTGNVVSNFGELLTSESSIQIATAIVSFVLK